MSFKCDCDTCKSYEALDKLRPENRIAAALEKIARELSRANELKACKLRSQAGRDSDLERIDEIMED